MTAVDGQSRAIEQRAEEQLKRFLRQPFDLAGSGCVRKSLPQGPRSVLSIERIHRLAAQHRRTFQKQ